MDEADIAEIWQRNFNERSIAAVRNSKQKENPLEIDGVRYCLRCQCVIDDERLRANPSAVRCVPCQSLGETRRG